MDLPRYQTLKTELSDRILTVTLNRPEAMNALNSQMGLDLIDVWKRLSAQHDDVRAVILTGSGERAFCAGGDFKERDGMTDDAWRAQHEIFEHAFQAIIDSAVPVIAAANGHAYGGGLEFVLAADFAYGVSTARFALTEVTIGIMPGGGGTQTLPRAVGPRRAKELILTGQPFSAEQALEWGVLNRVCEPGTLMDAVMATAKTIAGNAPLSVRQAKKSIQAGLQTDLHSGLKIEIEAYNHLVPTEDRREGIRAFVEKRKPAFHGR
ncbi:MAG TPA: enoyl-CoA hydratase-related protein [Alphaproteobacteria bacterium]|jgi:enoyl-CoA hydratase/carnithine racemase|nr:enoyl-CoA hydratase-related protein [Alphaproteobacteria bacterium]